MPRANCSQRRALAADPCSETYLGLPGSRAALSPVLWLAASLQEAPAQNRRRDRDRFPRASSPERGDCESHAPIRAPAPRRRRSPTPCHQIPAARAVVRALRGRAVLAALHKWPAMRLHVRAVLSPTGSAALRADRGEVIVKGPAW